MTEGRIHLVTMPKWGLAMHEGTIVDWLVKVGGSVRVGEPLCDVETAKIANAFDAPVAGTLVRVLHPSGSIAAVGEVIAVVVEGTVAATAIDAALAARVAAPGADLEAVGALRIIDTELGGVAALETGDPSAQRAILLLHGFGGDHANFDILQAALPSTQRVLALDLPGHGATTAGVGTGSADDVARGVLAALDALQLGPVDIVAHSFGAAVAAAVARTRPEFVASLLAIAPVGFGAQASAAYVEGYLAAERKRDMKPVMEMLFADPSLLSRTMVNDAVTRLRDPVVREALGRVGRSLVNAPPTDAAADLAELNRWPLTIVWGARDLVAPLPAGLAVAAGDRLHVVEGVGHMPHVEAPQIVTALVEDHLARVR